VPDFSAALPSFAQVTQQLGRQLSGEPIRRSPANVLKRLRFCTAHWHFLGTITKCFKLGHFPCFPQVTSDSSDAILATQLLDGAVFGILF